MERTVSERVGKGEREGVGGGWSKRKIEGGREGEERKREIGR